MMKLRIRSCETRETLRIEVPIPCSLQQLKRLLSQKLSSSSSWTPPESIHLSLNRKDEIRNSSPDEETLQSLGITSGDLVFFTLDPNVFSSETLVANSQEPTSKVTKNPTSSLSLDHKSQSEQDSTPVEWKNPEYSLHSDITFQVEHSQEYGSINLDTQSDEFVGDLEFDAIDDDDYDGTALEGFGKSFSAPGFLRKVFTEELGGDDGGRNHKLLVLAVHAVFLESGFVGFDMNLKTEVKGFQFRKDWPLNALGLSLFYTLPGIIGHVLSSSECHNGVAVLKFQNMGKFLNVYGSSNNGVSIHSVRLNEDELVPFLNVAWANCGLGEEITSKDGNSLTSPGSEVFNFWRTVKDKLTLPLLIDLCERVGLELPPCFMQLPTDLKLKILESLPGVDVAKVSCVSSELLYLSSSDNLWKQKFVEQFGAAGKSDERGNWKEKFARFWETRKRRKQISKIPFCRAVHPPRIIDPMSRFPRWPGIIGGDYDMGPQITHPFGQVGYRKTRYPSRSSIRWCNLGLVNRWPALKMSPQQEPYKIWINVERINDLCEKAILELPPCFMRLPIDLKLEILRLLASVDIARMSCVCLKSLKLELGLGKGLLITEVCCEEQFDFRSN